ncbi:MAG: accessory gene regulator B family protein [Bacilli bacterium]|nr:accessory gene regulator B family protein [Bacilli bacterium]
MRELFITNSLNSIKNKNPNYDKEKLEVIEYGLTGLYILITKSIIIFTIAYFLGIFKELLIFMIIYNLIRTVSFGIHLSSSLSCLITSAVAFLGTTILCKYCIIPINIKIIIGLLEIPYIYLHSPADTEKRPIVNPKRRLIYKLLSTIIAIGMIISSILIKNTFVSNSFILALLIQCIIISPITYKLTKQKYNNYIYYQIN